MSLFVSFTLETQVVTDKLRPEYIACLADPDYEIKVTAKIDGTACYIGPLTEEMARMIAFNSDGSFHIYLFPLVVCVRNLSVSARMSVYVLLSLPLYFSVSASLPITHTHTLSLSLSLSLCHSLYLSHTLSATHIHTHCLSHCLTHSLFYFHSSLSKEHCRPYNLKVAIYNSPNEFVKWIL